MNDKLIFDKIFELCESIFEFVFERNSIALEYCNFCIITSKDFILTTFEKFYVALSKKKTITKFRS